MASLLHCPSRFYFIAKNGKKTKASSGKIFARFSSEDDDAIFRAAVNAASIRFQESLRPAWVFGQSGFFITRGPSTSMRHCSVRLSLVAENSPLTNHSFGRATDDHLDKLLPRQLAYQTWSPSSGRFLLLLLSLGVLATVIVVVLLRVQVLTCHSPVRHLENPWH